MRQKMLIFILLISTLSYIYITRFDFSFSNNPINAALVALDSKNTGSLQNKKIKILIIPGHEPSAGGTDYKGIYERNLVVQLSDDLQDDLSTSTYDITLARDTNDWNPIIKKYVTENKDSIMAWEAEKKKEMLALVDAGKMTLVNPGMKHNDADTEALLYLYGLNKWADDNKIDLVINIHFNNNPKINGKPNYRGFTVYVPDKQYDNASTSKIFGNYLVDELSKIEPKSNMPQELGLPLEDQQLVAMGSYNTLSSTVSLVEYSYIYEQSMLNKGSRDSFIENAASSTASAIDKYVEGKLK